MDNTIFKKLKLKPNMTAGIYFPPPEYPEHEALANTEGNKNDFTHLFVTSQKEFTERFNTAAEAVVDDGLFWVSYPKSTRKQAYGINRDSLWHLVLPLGWHPVAQVSLSEEWSAVRLKRNVEGVVYEHPKNVKPKS